MNDGQLKKINYKSWQNFVIEGAERLGLTKDQHEASIFSFFLASLSQFGLIDIFIQDMLKRFLYCYYRRMLKLPHASQQYICNQGTFAKNQFICFFWYCWKYKRSVFVKFIWSK